MLLNILNFNIARSILAKYKKVDIVDTDDVVLWNGKASVSFVAVKKSDKSPGSVQ